MALSGIAERVRVIVESLEDHAQYGRVALVRDSYGNGRTINANILSGGGTIPQPGETWIIERINSTWVFTTLLSSVRPVVSGLIRDGSGEQSLVTGLATLGLVVDQTTPDADVPVSSLAVTDSDDIDFTLTGNPADGYNLTAVAKTTSDPATTPGKILKATSGGFITFPTPTATAHAATKGYVDGLRLSTSLGTADLDTIITPGTYYQSLQANATAARHYPYEGAGGSLMVWNNNPTPDAGMITQMFHARLTTATTSQNSLWLRFKQTSGAWSSWKEYRHSEDSRNPYATAAGTVTISLSAAATANAAVTFPAGKFTQPPIIQLTQASLPANSGQLIPKYTLASTSGFTAYAYTGNAATVTVSAAFTWTATQMTPTSGAG